MTSWRNSSGYLLGITTSFQASSKTSQIRCHLNVQQSLTRRGLLTERQHLKVANLWAHHDDHVGLQVTYLVYQDIIDAYANPKRSVGKKLMRKVMDTIRKGLPAGLEELAQLGRTLWRKRKQVLAFFDHSGASNGPVEAINAR